MKLRNFKTLKRYTYMVKSSYENFEYSLLIKFYTYMNLIKLSILCLFISLTFSCDHNYKPLVTTDNILNYNSSLELIDLDTYTAKSKNEDNSDIENDIENNSIINDKAIIEVKDIVCTTSPLITLEDQLGNNTITINDDTLVRHDLPNKYYPGIDFSSFQPYMSYTRITNKQSDAYRVVNSENCYTDELGFRRYKTNDDQFTIDGQDDYVIALGTFYKQKGVVGNRYLIVTTNGMYTAITGDEKSDIHTDRMNMFTNHNGKAGIIEWIIDSSKLNAKTRRAGTATVGGPDVVQGEIIHIYEIK